ncbi:MAG: PD-(D/E)XK nuclease family protein [Candidatus Colwellbacteria bacterium]|nr:PD-(D/E)XK nuclease family protein [Candidatus Colwellbacteria bacterium]MBI3274177.1 PD-(D/E)XK nuclease family protein [Candidatus Colwellbacteria bacterium]
MSQYYNPFKKPRTLFDPLSREPFPVSRSKIDLFLECPRCFYFDRRLGIGRPPGFPFSLNAAVDALLKKEFDIYRAKGVAHPLMRHYGIDAVPFKHEDIEIWRDSLRRGIEYLHKETNLRVKGGIDDVWIDSDDKLIIVDYKATAKNSEVNIDADWQIGYKRQIEVYQWLFRRNNFEVSDIGYFVYVNGKTDLEAFDGKLEFDVKIIPYTGNDSWIEKTLSNIKNALQKDTPPDYSESCDYCAYFYARLESPGEKKTNNNRQINPQGGLGF